MQSYNKFFKFASVRVFFRKKIEFILLFYARRWLWMLACGRHLGPCFFLLAFFLSSFYLAFFLLSRFSSFYLAFRPARVLSFVLLSRVSSCSRSFFSFFLLAFSFSSCSRSFFRPFISRFFLLAFSFSSCSRSFSSCSRSFFHPARVLFFFLLVFSFSSCSRTFFRPFISRFVLLEFIFLNKSPSKICIYQKFVVPLHSNLNILVRD